MNNSSVTQKADFSNIEKAFPEFINKPIWVASNIGDAKKPINPKTGGNAMSNNSDTWGTYQEVRAFIDKNPGHLPAIALSKGLGLTCIDLDNVHENGKTLPWAEDIYKKSASYTEISVSGNGLHVFIIATKPGAKCKKDGQTEIYDCDKFITVTGKVLSGHSEIKDAQEFLNTIYNETFTEEVFLHQDIAKTPSLSDGEVLAHCRMAKNGDRFKTLFDNGDISAYNEDASNADSALCAFLAFYTQDEEQIFRLIKQSKLFTHRKGKYPRKWERDKYREDTIKNAISALRNTYQPLVKNKNIDDKSFSTSSETTLNTGLCVEQPFPLEVLPAVLRDIVRKIATDSDSDPAISGTAAQSLVSTALKRTVRVIEKSEPFIQHYTTFFHTVVGESAQSRKSSNTKPLLRVFERYHKRSHEDYEKQMKLYFNAKHIAEKEKSEIKKDGNRSIEERAKALAEIDTKIEELKPKYYRLFTTDTTGPAFIMRLSETDGYFGIFTTDGGDLIDFIIGSPQTGTNDIIFVKLITNDDIQFDRVGPDRKGVSIDIPEPCGNVFIMTQEERWIRFNTHPRLKGSGLLGRNNPAIIAPRKKGYIEDEIEHENTPSKINSQMELQAWEELVMTFLKFDGEIILTLSKEAKEERRLLNNSFQSTVGVYQDNYDVSDIIHRTVSECVKRAALFHVCDHYRNMKNIPKEIPLSTFNRAVIMQTYYLQQAINARRGDIGKAESMELKAFLKKWIKRAEEEKKENKEKVFTTHMRASDLGKYFNTSKEKITVFLKKLEESDVVTELPAEGKKASRFLLNIQRANKFIGDADES